MPYCDNMPQSRFYWIFVNPYSPAYRVFKRKYVNYRYSDSMSRSLLSVQSPPADTQKPGSPALVASGQLEDPPDVAVLESPQVGNLGLGGRLRLEPPGRSSGEPLQVL